MQTLKKTVKKTSTTSTTTTRDKPKEEKLKAQEEKLKKSTYNVSTPRNFVQRSSAADIYQKTPKKLPGSSKDFKSSPMKDYLKSSPSSISQISSSSKVSSSSKTSKAKLSQNSVKPRTAKDLPFVNVTVNSPIAKRKLDAELSTKSTLDNNRTKQKTTENRREVKEEKQKSDRNKTIDEKGDFERMRSKTRTLNENEVKQLTLDNIDNNEEMFNLKQKLVAKPKAFYVGLDEEKAKTQNNKSDEDVSYEDDFESYESDFDSYHSEANSDHTDHEAGESRTNLEEDENASRECSDAGEEVLKEKDEESMLDSGSFDLREQRSAKTKPAAMEFILETEENTVTSLDEGFQEGSSAVSSMRTVHVEVLDRPLFIYFNKSKQQKRKKRIVEEMIRRAKDILSMVTLHEMPYTLFEMKPISYDLYMATFGRTNYTQIAVQTFEDGITEEIQTDDVEMENKWTQQPVKFSKSDAYLNDNSCKKNRRNSEDYMSKFSYLLEKNYKETNDFGAKEYKANPLRVLLEQKNGVGSCEMLPYETYKNKLKTDFPTNSLGKFLKKVERKVCHVLNLNRTVAEDVKKSTLPFSSGYVGITTKNVPDDMDYLKQAKITGLIFSEDKNNLILTVHRKHTNGILAGKCVICLWDASVARTEPMKVLVAIDNVAIGRFKGDSNGLLVAALEDGSIHLWDLSEEPTWRNDVVPKTVLEEVKTEALTQTEMDREWNLKNSNAGYDQLAIPHALQSCAYTSSAANMAAAEVTDRAVGLEFIAAQAQDAARKVVGQVCSLQRLGLLIIWTIVQEKTNTHDSGKAFWSKMKLEKTQTISLTNLLNAKEVISDNPFNLNAGKRRLVKRKQEKTLARNFSRQKSAEKSDIDRPSSVASARRLPVENNLPHDWESGLVCGDLKIMQYNNTDRYLVAKNNGEVLSCTRSLGVLKVERLCVSSDTSSITCLTVSHHGPYFLAGTDSGTVHLYSLAEARVLLTLDCRNGPPNSSVGPQADFKGSFVDGPRRHSHGLMETNLKDRLSVSSVLWSRVNPCSIFTLSHEGILACWELTHSDIYPRHGGSKATVASMAGDGTLALVTEEGEAQVHRLEQSKSLDYAQLFHRYLALL